MWWGGALESRNVFPSSSGTLGFTFTKPNVWWKSYQLTSSADHVPVLINWNHQLINCFSSKTNMSQPQISSGREAIHQISVKPCDTHMLG